MCIISYLNNPVRRNYRIQEYTGYRSLLLLQAYNDSDHRTSDMYCLRNQFHHTHKLQATIKQQ